MNTKFKRALSSVLAFIMLFSCITVMNVSSVWAATKDVLTWSAATNDKITDFASTSALKLVDGTDGISLSYLPNASGDSYIEVTADGYASEQGAILTGAGSTSKRLMIVDGAKAGDKVIVYYTSASDRVLTISNGTDATVSCLKSASSIGTAVKFVSYTVDKDGQSTFYSNNNKFAYVKVVVQREVADGATYPVSGTVTAGEGVTLAELDGFTFKVSGAMTATGTISAVNKDLPDGDYTVTADWDLYELAEAVSFTVSKAAVTDVNLTVNKKALTVVSGAVDAELAKSGDTLVFKNSQNEEITYSLDDNLGYTLSLPADTYTIYLRDGLYTQVPYYIDNDTVTVVAGTSALTHDIKATAEISTWDFATDVAKYVNSLSETKYYYWSEGGSGDKGSKFIKGLYLDTSSGKFKVDTSRSRVQVNKDTKIYVPVNTESDEVAFTPDRFTKGDITPMKDATGTTRNYRLYTNGTGVTVYVTKIAVTHKSTVAVSGKVTADAGITLPTVVKFTNTATSTVYSANVTDGAYTINLPEGSAEGTSYKITSDNLSADAVPGEITVASAAITQDINFTAAKPVTVSGKITSNTAGATGFVTELKFVNILDDTQTYTATVNGDTYSVNVAPGTNYKTVATVNNNMTTINKTAVGTESISDEEIYFVAPDTTPVDYQAEISVPSAEYPTITAALSAIKRMTDRGNKRVTLNLTGTFKEQVKMDVDNVTFKSTSGATITNYYGWGYKYYSVGSNGYYNEEYARDKYEKNEPARWAPTVHLTGKNFIAEGITFKNSFNYEVTAEEIADGVEPNPNSTNNNKMTTRIGADVQTRAMTERAAAITADNADKFELVNCQILSSQDTLTAHGGSGYIVNSTIGGNTDYICGDTPIIFDDCTLVWKGYTGSNTPGGHITAAKGKYLFRNCKVEKGSLTSAKGDYGRNWAAGSTVVFADTTADATMVEGFSNGLGYEPSQCHNIIATTDADYVAEPHKEATAVTYSTNTMGDTENVALVQRDYYLPNWIPTNYAFEDNTVVATEIVWDFSGSATKIPDQLIQNKNAVFESSVDGIYADVDASTGKLQVRSNVWAQFNNTTAVTVPVYAAGDKVTVAMYTKDYTINGVAATAETTTYTAGAAGKVVIKATADTYISKITVVTTAAPEAPTFSNVFNYYTNRVVDGNLYVVGNVTDLTKADSVGFGAGLTAGTALYSAVNSKFLDTDSVAEQVIAGKTEEVTVAEGKYVAAFEITGAQAGTTIYVVPFTTVGTSTVYGEAKAVTVAAAA